MKNFFKKYYRDIIIIFIIFITAITSLIVINVTSHTGNITAKVVHKEDVILTIDLSKESEEVREIIYPDKTIDFIIGVKKNAISVLHSGCPHQDCVHMGWVNSSNRPIICAHYQIVISISGESSSDVVIR